MNKPEKVSILGCGWLGFPLAEHLYQHDFLVKGSVRQKSDVEKLRQSGMKGFLVDVQPEDIKGDITGFLRDTEVLIISIPPGLRKDPSKSFVEKIRRLIPFIEDSEIKNVLFIGSTSVYADDNSIVTEKSVPHPEVESGCQLLIAERLLRKNMQFQTTLLRFGGLIGPERHPVHFLAGRKNIENPEAPVNLIHRNDCIHIIHSMLEQAPWGEVFNVAAPFHPKRETYYTEMALRNHLPVPKFNHSSASRGKIISSEKITKCLKYQFKKEPLSGYYK